MAIGIWSAVGGVAAAAGPPVGGLLVHVSWRLVFLVNLPVAVIAFGTPCGSCVRPVPTARPAPTSSAGSSLWSRSACSHSARQGTRLGLGERRDVCLADGRRDRDRVVLVALPRAPLPDRRPSDAPGPSFALASSASIAFNAAFAAMLLGNVLFLTGVWHYSVRHAGVALMPGPAMAAITAVRVAGSRPVRPAQGRDGGHRAVRRRRAPVAVAPRRNAVICQQMLPGQIMTGTGVGLTLPSLASAAAASSPGPVRHGVGGIYDDPADRLRPRRLDLRRRARQRAHDGHDQHLPRRLAIHGDRQPVRRRLSLPRWARRASTPPEPPEQPKPPERPRPRRSHSVRARHPDHDARPTWYG